MTNQWGIELSSNVADDIRNEYRYGEGEYETLKEIILEIVLENFSIL
jgi:hypothetical protein